MESAFDVCTEDLFNQVFGEEKKLFEQKIDIYVHFIFLPTNHDARLSSLQTFYSYIQPDGQARGNGKEGGERRRRGFGSEIASYSSTG